MIMSRTAITIELAAYDMLENGYEGSEVVSILNALPQPSVGYVYADEVHNLKNIQQIA